MNKKFLSAILFGALMVTSTGTFVSCKDYDDDIKGLQEQIDKLATKDDLKAQISTLQAGLTSAAKDASDAITKATAAETAAKAAGDAAAAAKAAADKVAAEAKAEAIKAVQAEIEALKKEVNASTESALAEMRKEVAIATKKVEDIIGKIADMVTSVELITTWYANNPEAGPEPLDLNFMTAVEKKNVFSADITNAITFTEGKQVQTGSKFMVRVSPTNAVLTPEMISLTNSKGQNLNDFITIEKVEKYDGLLSYRAASNTGLWEVTVALNSYDEKAFAAVTRTKVGDDIQKILFAVHVNNTLSTAETREVTSTYDLSLFWNPYEGAKALNYFVDKTNVKDVHNRYSTAEDGTAAIVKELAWSGDASTTVVAPDKTNPNTVYDTPDNRQEKVSYPAIQGQAVKIALSTTTDKVTAPTNIRAMYVVLDKANAVESAPSEINAWNSYSYTGLNTVVEGTSTEIIINSNTAINDIIGFRVFAVNYDGTLVDPDGKAFYVKVGTAATDWNAVATTIIPDADKTTAPDTEKSGKQDVTLTKLTGATTATWTTDKIGTNDHVFDVYFETANGAVYNTTALNSFPADFSKVTKVYTMPALSGAFNLWVYYEDSKAYNGTLTIKNADGFVLATLNVSMKKELPTTLPAGFTFKDKQVINGIYNCYLIADNWAAKLATKGTMPIENFVNFGDGFKNQYKVVLAESQKDNEGKLEAQTVAGNGSIDVTKEFIDNSKEHATTISYDYGVISSQKDDKGYFKNVEITAAEIKTVYCCFYKTEVHTWAWATLANLGLKSTDKLPFSTELTYGSDAAAPTSAHIFGKNIIDGTFSKALNATYGSSLEIQSAELISDNTGKADYFTVDFNAIAGDVFKAIKKDIGSNPKENVPSTLNIKCKDSYGHDIVISLKMTVKPQ